MAMLNNQRVSNKYIYIYTHEYPMNIPLNPQNSASGYKFYSHDIPWRETHFFTVHDPIQVAWQRLA